MAGKLSSLTDVLKKTLFFLDGLSASEIAPYVHQKMLQDYSLAQIEEKVQLCLNQNPCFYEDNSGLWYLNTEGVKENNNFYKTLQRKKQPMSIKEVTKNTRAKKTKAKKLAEEASLFTDGRFVQLEDGNWGLTEWSNEPEIYSLKHLVIKALKSQPAGMSHKELVETVQAWMPITAEAVKQLLDKFPYFEKSNDVYTYNKSLHLLHDSMVKRYLGILRRQKQKWAYDRERWNIKINNLKKQLEEAAAAQREAAAAVAERVSIADQYHHLATQLSEKDLLLSMRKKEILRYREQLAKMEKKANSILHQCRIWVRRTEERDREIKKLKEYNEKNQASLETLFSKLQQYKDRDRANKAKIAELKEHYTTRIAELQTEIVDLKQKLERVREKSELEERSLYQDLNNMSNDLKEALEKEEELKKSIRLLQQELDRLQQEKRQLEKMFMPLPVRIALKICSLLGFY
ncbi:MAG: phage-shock protein [Desulfotomaculum sp.]|nr:phage-shock protein [Desulfotomaculum sp.]